MAIRPRRDEVVSLFELTRTTAWKTKVDLRRLKSQLSRVYQEEIQVQ